MGTNVSECEKSLLDAKMIGGFIHVVRAAGKSTSRNKHESLMLCDEE